MEAGFVSPKKMGVLNESGRAFDSLPTALQALVNVDMRRA